MAINLITSCYAKTAQRKVRAKNDESDVWMGWDGMDDWMGWVGIDGMGSGLLGTIFLGGQWAIHELCAPTVCLKKKVIQLQQAVVRTLIGIRA